MYYSFFLEVVGRKWCKLQKKHFIIEPYLMIGSEVPPKTNIARSENMEVAVGPSMNQSGEDIPS